MAKILTFEIPEDSYKELEETIDNLISEMKIGREKMRKDQEEIDRLKIETRKIAAESRKVLAELESKLLKAA
jgi:hypothetical protein